MKSFKELSLDLEKAKMDFYRFHSTGNVRGMKQAKAQIKHIMNRMKEAQRYGI